MSSMKDGIPLLPPDPDDADTGIEQQPVENTLPPDPSPERVLEAPVGEKVSDSKEDTQKAEKPSHGRLGRTRKGRKK